MATLIEVNGRKIRADLIEQGRTMGRSEERLRRKLMALRLDAETAAGVSKLLDPRGVTGA